jgi:hypothetical protein
MRLAGPAALAVLTLVLLITPFDGEAQPGLRAYRVGWLSGYAVDEPFRQGLRSLGYVEGQNLVLEIRQYVIGEKLLHRNHHTNP